jgi:hypothetical protein
MADGGAEKRAIKLQRFRHPVALAFRCPSTIDTD